LVAEGEASTINSKAVLNKGFSANLEDTEIIFSHRHKEKISLKDIFVSPDLKNIKSEFDEIDKTTRALDLVDSMKRSEKILILGAEQSGKTALSKMLFSELWEKNQNPLLCNGKRIKDAEIDKLLNKLITEQYDELPIDAFFMDRNKVVFIIDDYEKISINIRFQKLFLSNLSKTIGKIIIISNTSIRYDEGKFVELLDFTQYEILPFGNLRRGELIEKWNCIGRTETIRVVPFDNLLIFRIFLSSICQLRGQRTGLLRKLIDS